MVKIIKHEFKRTLIPKIVLVCIIVGAWLITTIGMSGMSGDQSSGISVFGTMFNTGMAILVLGIIGMFMYLGIESILLLAKDVNTKEGYMLFMTPNKYSKILGGKMIMMLISLVVATGLTIALSVGLFELFLYKNEINLALILKSPLFQEFTSFFENAFIIKNLFGAIVLNITSWCYVVTVGYLVVILTSFIKIKSNAAKSLLAIVIFITINQFISFIISLIVRVFSSEYEMIGVSSRPFVTESIMIRDFLEGFYTFAFVTSAIYVILAVGAFVLSVKLLEKKVSI